MLVLKMLLPCFSRHQMGVIASCCKGFSALHGLKGHCREVFEGFECDVSCLSLYAIIHIWMLAFRTTISSLVC